jgi:hypothetical protein
MFTMYWLPTWSPNQFTIWTSSLKKWTWLYTDHRPRSVSVTYHDSYYGQRMNWPIRVYIGATSWHQTLVKPLQCVRALDAGEEVPRERLAMTNRSPRARDPCTDPLWPREYGALPHRDMLCLVRTSWVNRCHLTTTQGITLSARWRCALDNI